MEPAVHFEGGGICQTNKEGFNFLMYFDTFHYLQLLLKGFESQNSVFDSLTPNLTKLSNKKSGKTKTKTKKMSAEKIT